MQRTKNWKESSKRERRVGKKELGAMMFLMQGICRQCRKLQEEGYMHERAELMGGYDVCFCVAGIEVGLRGKGRGSRQG
jgi:hypothetical protein